jgi:hypothetical protein
MCPLRVEAASAVPALLFSNADELPHCDASVSVSIRPYDGGTLLLAGLARHSGNWSCREDMWTPRCQVGVDTLEGRRRTAETDEEEEQMRGSRAALSSTAAHNQGHGLPLRPGAAAAGASAIVPHGAMVGMEVMNEDDQDGYAGNR